jgi:hypothetical protein
MTEEDLAFQFALACLLCAAAAAIGFNRPSWARSYTTAARYWIAFLLHVVLYLVVYLAAFIVLRQLFVRGFGLPSRETILPATWLAFVAVFVWRIASSRPQTWLHEHASIPRCAHRFATALANRELKPAAAIEAQARSALLSRGIDVDADWLPLARPTNRSLLQATMLFLQIREWETDRRLARFAMEARNELDSLRRRFDRLSFRVARSLASIERLGQVVHLHQHSDAPGSEEAQQADALTRKIVTDLLADCCEDIRNFHECSCQLAARAALCTRYTEKGRDAFIRKLGFESHRESRAQDYFFLATTAILLYAGLWLFFQILPPVFRNGDLDPRERVLVVSLIVFGSLLIAIVPKLHWGFANAGLRRRTPIGFVLGAGICAIAFALLVHFAAGALLIGGLEGALGRMRLGSSWLLSTFLTASVMAWLVQDHRWRRAHSPLDRRVLDGLTLGVAWIVGSCAGKLIQARLLQIDVDAQALLFPALGSFVIGALIAFIAAESARRVELRTHPHVPASPAISELQLARPRSATA